MSRGYGFEGAGCGIKLTCFDCAATEVLTFDEARTHWQEQMRRDRVLALAGIVPEDLTRS